MNAEADGEAGMEIFFQPGLGLICILFHWYGSYLLICLVNRDLYQVAKYEVSENLRPSLWLFFLGMSLACNSVRLWDIQVSSSHKVWLYYRPMMERLRRTLSLWFCLWIFINLNHSPFWHIPSPLVPVQFNGIPLLTKHLVILQKQNLYFCCWIFI